MHRTNIVRQSKYPTKTIISQAYRTNTKMMGKGALSTLCNIKKRIFARVLMLVFMKFFNGICMRSKCIFLSVS